jgi:hypothetical protein
MIRMKAKLVSVLLMVLSGSSLLLVMAAGVPEGPIEKLSSDQFEVRHGAYAEIEKWAKKNIETAPELLLGAWQKNPDPEAKTRCFELMKQSAILRKFGRGKGFVGIMMDPAVLRKAPMAQPQKKGIRVVQVLPGTPAQKAGLKAGDLILGIDALDFSKLPVDKERLDVRSVFQEYVKSKHPDDVITLHLLREGKKQDKKVTLMKRPASADLGIFGGPADDERKKSELFFQQWLKQAQQ